MPKYYEFEVSLRHIKPRIWRRFLLRKTATFSDLHNAIQEAFGWGRYHLWEFHEPGRRGETIAGVPDVDGWGTDVPEASRVKLSGYFIEDLADNRCVYVYDFGDDWEHNVSMRKVVTDKERFERRLLAGRCACPPEDCGGVPGYERMVGFVKTGKDIYGDDAVDLAEWLGDWKPDHFDLEKAHEQFDC